MSSDHQNIGDHIGLSTATIDMMLRDTGTLEKMGAGTSEFFRELVKNVCCHVKALAAEEERLRTVANMAHAWMIAESGSGEEQNAAGCLADALEHAGYSL